MIRKSVLGVAVAALALVSLGGCSTEDLAAFNAGLESYNGVVYHDTTDSPMTLQCASGNGHLIAHGGVRNNQQYTYVVSRAPQGVDVTIRDQAGGGTTVHAPRGGTSQTYWTYPSYDLSYSWAC